MVFYLKILKFFIGKIPLLRNSDGFNQLKVTIPRNTKISGHFRFNTTHLGQKMLEACPSN